MWRWWWPGLKRDMCYEDLHRASSLIRGGARFVGTPTRTPPFPWQTAYAPGAGSLLAALQVAGGAEPFIIGKPHAPMFEAALQLLGCEAEQTLMIGDRLNTDILGGARAGMRTALVLSGISTREELGKQPAATRFRLRLPDGAGGSARAEPGVTLSRRDLLTLAAGLPLRGDARMRGALPEDVLAQAREDLRETFAGRNLALAIARAGRGGRRALSHSD